MPPKQQKSTPEATGAGGSGAPRSSLLSSESGDSVEPMLLLPPDGGYGWVVVVACFLMNLFADGCIFTFGFHQESVQREFKKGAAEVALLPSLCAGFYFLAGPLWCATANRWGFRIVSVLGAVMSAGAFAACFFLDAFYLFILAFVVLGISSGAVNISTTIVVGLYFERWRGVATCLTSCGSGVGVLVLPLCYKALQTVKGYTWRWVFLLNGSLLTLVAILALLLRPLKPVAMTRGERTVRFQDDSEVKGRKGMRLLRQRGTQPLPMAGLPAVAAAPAPLGRTSNVTLTTLRQIRPSQTSFSPSVFAPQFDAVSMTSRMRSGQEVRDSLVGPRPMQRDDIFYQASASRLSAQLSTRFMTLSPRLPVGVPEAEGVLEQRVRGWGSCPGLCALCPRAVLHSLANLLDCSLLANSVFMVFAASQVFVMLGYYTPFIFMQSQAEDHGVPRRVAEWILPALGMANAVGRALAGALCEVLGVSAISLSCVSLTLASIVVAATCYSSHATYQIFIAAAYGLLVAPCMTMKSLILVDFLGIERLTNSFGLLLMLQGISVIIGPPLNGWIRDCTNSYTYVFLISGAFMLLAANLPYLMFPLSKYEEKKEIRRALQI